MSTQQIIIDLIQIGLIIMDIPPIIMDLAPNTSNAAEALDTNF